MSSKIRLLLPPKRRCVCEAVRGGSLGSNTSVGLHGDGWEGNGRIALSAFGHIGVFLSILDTNTMVEITLARRIGVRKVAVMIKNF